jgi:hypothetical protein
MILDVFVRVSFLFPVGTKISVYERPAGLIQACRVKRPQSAAADVVLQTRPNQTKNTPPPLILATKPEVMKGMESLKVVGNEKKGGLRFLQLLGISLGPWRSMSIFILNVPFAIDKRISFSALSSKMNRRFV